MTKTILFSISENTEFNKITSIKKFTNTGTSEILLTYNNEVYPISAGETIENVDVSGTVTFSGEDISGKGILYQFISPRELREQITQQEEQI